MKLERVAIGFLSYLIFFDIGRANTMNQFKNIITGEIIVEKSFERDWQEFYIKRQNEIDKQTDSILMKEIKSLLDQINDIKLKNAISDIIIARENIVTYAYYCHGFADGTKQISICDNIVSKS